MSDRIVTVSTIRDSVTNVHRFVERNLSSGIDHMVVFLDEDQPDVRGVLGSNPRVTVVQTAKGYWKGRRPPKVEDRQKANANLANAALTAFPDVRWLVHLDADEALWFDRASLLASEARAVRFPALEAVARRARPDGDVAEFKRIPSEAELLALNGLGAIHEATNEAYYRGHMAGKSAVRPDLGVRIGVHVPHDPHDNRIPVEVLPECYLLHYESYCLEDFVERWRSFDLKKARRSNHRDSRKRLGIAAYAITNHPTMDDRTKDRYLRRLFERKVADDVTTLRRLGLIIEVPAGGHQPRPLPQDETKALKALLTALRTVDKEAFLAEADAGAPAAALEESLAALDDSALAERVRRSVAEHRVTTSDS